MSKFQKGESGNPSGRPKGIKDRRALFASILEEHKEALLQKGLDMAICGSEAMLKLFLERLLPAKPKDQPIDGVDLNGTLEDQVNAITAAISDGTLTPSEGNYLFSLLVKRITVINMVEIEEQFEELKSDVSSKKKWQ